jgi:hypothetical protein
MTSNLTQMSNRDDALLYIHSEYTLCKKSTTDEEEANEKN